MYKKLLVLALGASLVLSVGCGKEPAPKADSGKGSAYAEIVDTAGNKLVLAKAPQRVVSLSPSYLEMIDAVGGTIVGRTKTINGKVPKSMEKVPEVGHVFNANMEALVGLKPDLVLLNAGQHERFVSMLKSNKIEVLLYSPRTFEETKSFIRDMGKIYNTKDKAEAVCKKMDDEVKTIVAKLPKDKKRIVVMHVTANSVSVAGSNSIAGSITDMLGMENVAAKALKGNSEKTSYSMEALLEQDPDILFITSMGKSKNIEKRLQADFQSNPAWKGLKAVKAGRVYVLSEKLFLVNPGLEYPKAIQTVAEDAYPEAFKK